MKTKENFHNINMTNMQWTIRFQKCSEINEAILSYQNVEFSSACGWILREKKFHKETTKL